MLRFRFERQLDEFVQHGARLGALSHQLQTDQAAPARRMLGEHLVGQINNLCERVVCRLSPVLCQRLDCFSKAAELLFEVGAAAVDLPSSLSSHIDRPASEHRQQLVCGSAQCIAHETSGFQPTRLGLDALADRRWAVRAAAGVMPHQSLVHVRRPSCGYLQHIEPVDLVEQFSHLDCRVLQRHCPEPLLQAPVFALRRGEMPAPFIDSGVTYRLQQCRLQELLMAANRIGDHTFKQTVVRNQDAMLVQPAFDLHQQR